METVASEEDVIIIDADNDEYDTTSTSGEAPASKPGSSAGLSIPCFESRHSREDTPEKRKGDVPPVISIDPASSIGWECVGDQLKSPQQFGSHFKQSSERPSDSPLDAFIGHREDCRSQGEQLGSLPGESSKGDPSLRGQDEPGELVLKASGPLDNFSCHGVECRSQEELGSLPGESTGSDPNQRGQDEPGKLVLKASGENDEAFAVYLNEDKNDGEEDGGRDLQIEAGSSSMLSSANIGELTQSKVVPSGEVIPNENFNDNDSAGYILECPGCHFKFANLAQYILHLERDSGKILQIHCSRCDKMLQSQNKCQIACHFRHHLDQNYKGLQRTAMITNLEFPMFIFNCLICKVNFSSSVRFEKHLIKTNDYRSVTKCSICEQVIKYMNECEKYQHEATHEKPLGQFNQLVKSSSFELEGEDEKSIHISRALYRGYTKELAEDLYEGSLNLGGREQYCIECHTPTTYIVSHLQGMGNQTDFDFQCQFCGLIMMSKCSYLAHKKLHHVESKERIKEEAFMCPECGLKFMGSWALFMKHLLEECLHGVKLFRLSCALCKKNVYDSVLLSRHMESHIIEFFHCVICKQGFAQMKNLIRHHRQKHGNAGSQVKTDSLRHCLHCPKPLRNKRLEEDHIKKHVKESISKSVFEYVCLECEGTVFKSRESLIEHKLNKHLKGHYCKCCSKAFLSYERFQKHVSQLHKKSESSSQDSDLVKATQKEQQTITAGFVEETEYKIEIDHAMIDNTGTFEDFPTPSTQVNNTLTQEETVANSVNVPVGRSNSGVQKKGQNAVNTAENTIQRKLTFGTRCLSSKITMNTHAIPTNDNHKAFSNTTNVLGTSESQSASSIFHAQNKEMEEGEILKDRILEEGGIVTPCHNLVTQKALHDKPISTRDDSAGVLAIPETQKTDEQLKEGAMLNPGTKSRKHKTHSIISHSEQGSPGKKLKMMVIKLPPRAKATPSPSDSVTKPMQPNAQQKESFLIKVVHKTDKEGKKSYISLCGGSSQAARPSSETPASIPAKSDTETQETFLPISEMARETKERVEQGKCNYCLKKYVKKRTSFHKCFYQKGDLAREVGPLSENKCAHCLSQFQSKYQLMDHMHSQTFASFPLLTCTICSSVLQNKCALKAHMNLHTTNFRGPSTCPECGLLFEKQNKLRKHVIDKCFHNNRLACIKCTLCKNSIPLYDFLDHILKGHSWSGACLWCGVEGSDMEDHYRDHLEALTMIRVTLRYFCHRCPGSSVYHFSKLDDLLGHLSTDHNDVTLPKATKKASKAKSKLVPGSVSPKNAKSKSLSRKRKECASKSSEVAAEENNHVSQDNSSDLSKDDQSAYKDEMSRNLLIKCAQKQGMYTTLAQRIMDGTLPEPVIRLKRIYDRHYFNCTLCDDKRYLYIKWLMRHYRKCHPEALVENTQHELERDLTCKRDGNMHEEQTGNVERSKVDQTVQSPILSQCPLGIMTGQSLCSPVKSSNSETRSLVAQNVSSGVTVTGNLNPALVISSSMESPERSFQAQESPMAVGQKNVPLMRRTNPIPILPRPVQNGPTQLQYLPRTEIQAKVSMIGKTNLFPVSPIILKTAPPKLQKAPSTEIQNQVVKEIRPNTILIPPSLLQRVPPKLYEAPRLKELDANVKTRNTVDKPSTVQSASPKLQIGPRTYIQEQILNPKKTDPELIPSSALRRAQLNSRTDILKQNLNPIGTASKLIPLNALQRAHQQLNIVSRTDNEKQGDIVGETRNDVQHQQTYIKTSDKNLQRNGTCPPLQKIQKINTMSHSCEFCGQTSETRIMVLVHISTEHSGFLPALFCPICDRRNVDVTFGNRNDLQNHLLSNHSQEKKKEDEGSYYFICYLCNSNLPNIVSFISHTVEDCQSSESKVKCPWCQYKNIKNLDLEIHIYAQHKNMIERFFRSSSYVSSSSVIYPLGKGRYQIQKSKQLKHTDENDAAKEIEEQEKETSIVIQNNLVKRRERKAPRKSSTQTKGDMQDIEEELMSIGEVSVSLPLSDQNQQPGKVIAIDSSKQITYPGD